MESQKENSPNDPVVYIPPQTPNSINLEKFDFKNNKTSFLTESSKSNNTPIRSLANFVKIKKHDQQSTPNSITGSLSKKRKQENLNMEVTEVDSPDLAAKKEFFNLAKKNKVAKKEIKYLDDSDVEVTMEDDSRKHETEMVIDSSLEDRFENFMKNTDVQEKDESRKKSKKKEKPIDFAECGQIIPPSPAGFVLANFSWLS